MESAEGATFGAESILADSDILLLILSQLSPLDILRVAATSVAIAHAANEPSLWERLMMEAVDACCLGVCSLPLPRDGCGDHLGARSYPRTDPRGLAVELHKHLQREMATACAHCMCQAKARYWTAMPSLATMGVATAARTLTEPASPRCLLALVRLPARPAFEHAHGARSPLTTANAGRAGLRLQRIC